MTITKIEVCRFLKTINCIKPCNISTLKDFVGVQESIYWDIHFQSFNIDWLVTSTHDNKYAFMLELAFHCGVHEMKKKNM